MMAVAVYRTTMVMHRDLNVMKNVFVFVVLRIFLFRIVVFFAFITFIITIEVVFFLLLLKQVLLMTLDLSLAEVLLHSMPPLVSSMNAIFFTVGNLLFPLKPFFLALPSFIMLFALEFLCLASRA